MNAAEKRVIRAAMARFDELFGDDYDAQALKVKKATKKAKALVRACAALARANMQASK